MRIFLFIIAFLFINNIEAQILLDQSDEPADLAVLQLLQEAQVLMNEEEYEIATDLLIKVVTLDSNILSIYNMIYQSSYKSGQYAIGIKYLKLGTAIYPLNDQLEYFLGRTYQKLDKLKLAESCYDRALEKYYKEYYDNPYLAHYYANRGIVRMKQHKYHDALTDFNAAIKTESGLGSVYANRGYVLYKLDRLDEACKSWSKAKELGIGGMDKYINKYCKS